MNFLSYHAIEVVQRFKVTRSRRVDRRNWHSGRWHVRMQYFRYAIKLGTFVTFLASCTSCACSTSGDEQQFCSQRRASRLDSPQMWPRLLQLAQALAALCWHAKIASPLNSVAHMPRHYFGARGNALTFSLPSKDLFAALQGEEATRDKPLKLPRMGEELGRMARVLLKANNIITTIVTKDHIQSIESCRKLNAFQIF